MLKPIHPQSPRYPSPLYLRCWELIFIINHKQENQTLFVLVQRLYFNIYNSQSLIGLTNVWDGLFVRWFRVRKVILCRAEVTAVTHRVNFRGNCPLQRTKRNKKRERMRDRLEFHASSTSYENTNAHSNICKLVKDMAWGGQVRGCSGPHLWQWVI